uniref:NADH-ubiquinone oxidoreductase chain 1 n=1 Tax=Liposcelis nr. bostrychophila AZ TaxID=1643344 RepID=A0A0F6QIR6_9NEOP|nr:NADH dehydrogenase subunit 1 [Liposcelis nr. bostrychophila AZ]
MILIFYFLLILLSVAFFTLLERKFLGFVQIRKGPFKVGLVGMFQPFSDAIKLFSKSSFFSIKSNHFLSVISPIYFFFLSLIFFFFKPFFSLSIFSLLVLILMFLYSIGIYCTLFTGWASNSKFSLIGSIRSITQSISYEITLGVIFLYFSLSYASLNLFFYMNFNVLFFNLLMNFLILSLFMINFLIESNRTPFDLAECESELVSGFNVEYGGMEFSLIFLGENLMLIFNSLVITIYMSSIFYISTVWIVMVMVMILIRGAYPRLRLDFMLKLCWLKFLPFTLIMMQILIFIIYS